MMSGVPPVFIAAIGMPSALASMRTRLRDSGPDDGKTSRVACASHVAVSDGSSQPRRRMSLPLCAAWRSNRTRSGPSPTMMSGQSRSARLTTSGEVGRALVRRELADIEGVRPGHRWRRGGPVTYGVRVDGIRDDLDARPLEDGCTRLEIRGDPGTDGNHRVRVQERILLPPQVGLQIGAHHRGCEARHSDARPSAVNARDARAAGAQRETSRAVNEIRPIAHRPVVADGADRRDAGLLCRFDRGDARHDVLPVDDRRSAHRRSASPVACRRCGRRVRSSGSSEALEPAARRPDSRSPETRRRSSPARPRASPR